MHSPGRERVQFLRFLHVIEKCKHFAELVCCIGRNAFRAVFRVEFLQTFVSEVPYSHLSDCSLSLNTRQAELVVGFPRNLHLEQSADLALSQTALRFLDWNHRLPSCV